MDISKLTIQGFKSFYEKSVFTFGKNITAIVGPNGSGKSNIMESIRFVLGEQSTKSLRGKDITDLLYKGNSSKSNKAKVEIEFVKSNQSSLKSSLNSNTENIFIKNALEKETVIIARTIYADGKSIYEMNGVEVRLKDIQEFLLFINLGNKSSWHISQGEADRVLQANSQERRTIIEDALGLKIYHARINESGRKLEKTKENIREAGLKRKEILPELSILGRQVERIRKSAEYRSDLEEKGHIYLQYKFNKLENLKNTQKNNFGNLESLKEKLNSLEKEIIQKEKKLYSTNSQDVSILENECRKEQKVIEFLNQELSEFNRNKNNIENVLRYGELEYSKNIEELQKIELELKDISSAGNDIIFSENDINKTRADIELNLEKILNFNQNVDITEVKNLAKESDFLFKKLISKGSVVTKDNVKQISYLQSIKNRILEKIDILKQEKNSKQEELNLLNPKIENTNLKLKLSKQKYEDFLDQIRSHNLVKAETEMEVQKLNFECSQLQIKISQTKDFVYKIEEIEREIDSDMLDFKNILGTNFSFNISKFTNLSIPQDEAEFQNTRRAIERLKIRLEESIVANPDVVMTKYNEMTERDQFLLKEIEDLEKSMLNLEKLIEDLKISLKQEFDLGLEHINNIFDSYVKRLFGGGSAKVYVVEIENKKKVGVDSDEEDNDENDKKIGVEVEVEIPKKKIKGLHSLSGGERALVSIALNFSIVNQNPSPFMILDETDAALDEANSKRYGEILEMLKVNTKLIVVTHNRETMHFADQIFGVTLHKDGHSKVLSVSFDDAIEFAK